MSAFPSTGRLTSVRPLWAIEGGRVTLEGDRLSGRPGSAQVRVGAQPARLAGCRRRLTIIVPFGLEGGATAMRLDELPGETAYIEVARTVRHRRAPGGQPGVRSPRQPVRHLQRRARPAGAGLDLPRPARRHPRAVLSAIVQSRRRSPSIPTAACMCPAGSTAASTGSNADGRAELFASDLGVACGLAFAPDGTLFVGDRSGTIFRVERDGTAQDVRDAAAQRRGLPSRLRPRRCLYVDGADARHARRRSIASTGSAEPTRLLPRLRPSAGLAFDAAAHLYVVDALAGASGVYRVRLDAPPIRSWCSPGRRSIGVAFDPHGGLAIATTDAVYRLNVGLRGMLPLSPQMNAGRIPRQMTQLFRRKPISDLLVKASIAQARDGGGRPDHAGHRRRHRRRHLRRDRHGGRRADRSQRRGDPLRRGAGTGAVVHSARWRVRTRRRSATPSSPR